MFLHFLQTAVEENHLHELANLLAGDSIINGQKLRFHNSLGLPSAEFEEIRNLNSYEFFHHTLQKWRCQKGGNATFDVLARTLEKETFVQASGKLNSLEFFIHIYLSLFLWLVDIFKII